MATYDVVALGNALVDKEFEVTPDFLASQNIEKGVMTLIEKDVHLSLLEALSEHCDLRKRACGGSAANTIVTAGQYGASSYYCCKVGDDEFGQFYQDDLHAANVNSRLAEQNTPGDTGKCIVMVTADADRTMNTYLGITSTFGRNEIVPEAIANAKYLYIEGHLVYSPEAVDAIVYAKSIARENGVKVALTVSDPAVVKYVREHLDKVIGDDGVDLLFCNEDEATDYGNGDFDAGVSAFLEKCPHVVVTKGEKGATIYQHNVNNIDVSAYNVKAVDTTGAGDTFAGAYLYAVTQGKDLRDAGVLACKTASECVANFGPRLNMEQQQSILSQWQKGEL